MGELLAIFALLCGCVPDGWSLRAPRDAAADVTDATPADVADASPSDASDACAGAVCNGRCVDLATDRLHCGGCDRPCSGTCAVRQ